MNSCDGQEQNHGIKAFNDSTYGREESLVFFELIQPRSRISILQRIFKYSNVGLLLIIAHLQASLLFSSCMWSHSAKEDISRSSFVNVTVLTCNWWTCLVLVICYASGCNPFLVCVPYYHLNMKTTKHIATYLSSPCASGHHRIS